MNSAQDEGILNYYPTDLFGASASNKGDNMIR